MTKKKEGARKRAAASDRENQKPRRKKAAKPRNRPTTAAAREAAKDPEAAPVVMCNEKELAFIEHYTGQANYNGAKAIRLAGIHDDIYVSRVYASQWLNRPHVQAEILKRCDERRAQLAAVRARLLEEQLAVGLSSIGDVVEWDDDRVSLVPKSELLPEQISAIAQIEVTINETIRQFAQPAKQLKNGNTVPAKPEIIQRTETRRVRMHDKLAALAAMQKQLETPEALLRRGAGGGNENPGGVTIIVDGGATGLEFTIKEAAA